MKEKRANIFYIFLLHGLIFVFIYNPPFHYLPFNSAVVLGLFSNAYLLMRVLLHKTPIGILKKPILYPFTALAILIIYSVIYSIICETYDFQLAKTGLSLIIVYCLGGGIIYQLLIKIKVINWCDFLKIIINVITLQGLIIILMLLIPSLKEIIFESLKDGDVRAVKNLSSGGFRFLGLAYGVTWDMSFVQSVGLILIAYISPTLGVRQAFKYALFFIIILISCLISGRTGYIGVSLAILLMGYNLFFNTAKGIWATLRVILYFIILSFSIVAITYVSLSEEMRNILDNKVFPWLFEMFIKQNEGSGFSTNSSDELKSMYFSISAKTALIGDGQYVSPIDPTRYYMDTDAGYMRHLLFYGIVGSVMLYGFYMNLFYSCLKHCKRNREAVILFSFLFFYFFFAHIKGDILLGGDMPIKLLFLLVIGVFSGIINIETHGPTCFNRIIRL